MSSAEWLLWVKWLFILFQSPLQVFFCSGRMRWAAQFLHYGPTSAPLLPPRLRSSTSSTDLPIAIAGNLVCWSYAKMWLYDADRARCFLRVSTHRLTRSSWGNPSQEVRATQDVLRFDLWLAANDKSKVGACERSRCSKRISTTAQDGVNGRMSESALKGKWHPLHIYFVCLFLRILLSQPLSLCSSSAEIITICVRMLHNMRLALETVTTSLSAVHLCSVDRMSMHLFSGQIILFFLFLSSQSNQSITITCSCALGL